jgi:hypothetical protein
MAPGNGRVAGKFKLAGDSCVILSSRSRRGPSRQK